MAQREAGHLIGDRHHLFLIDDYAIRVLEDRFQFRNFIGNRDLALFSFDEVGDEIHWTGPVQRDNGDDIFESVGFQSGQQIPHARAFQLEHTRCFSRAQQRERGHVIKEHVIDRQGRCLRMRLVDEGLGSSNHREGLETEEVELHQPNFLDIPHRVLGHDFIVGPLVERHMVGEWSFRDHDTRSMGRGVTGESFKRLRVGHQLFDLGIRVNQLAQAGFCLQGLLQRDIQLGGDELRHFVGVRVGHFQHTSHIADRRLGAERTEGNDLGDMVGTILLHHIADHFPPPVHAEIHIDIGKRDAFRIQETLEQ